MTAVGDGEAEAGGVLRRLPLRPPDLRQRLAQGVREGAERVRFNIGLAVQAGIAGALAWFVAHDIIGNPEPIFAPITAVGMLAVSAGQRLRRSIETIFGVGVGVTVGDALIYLTGTGTWQMAAMVTLAIITALFLNSGVGVMIQAAATAVLLATLTPQGEDPEFPRFVDAFLGGIVALVVAMLVVPFNPVRHVVRAAQPALDVLARELIETGQALRTGDARLAQNALDALREAGDELDALEEAIEAGRETATLAPVRWRRRPTLRRYVNSIPHLHRILNNSGGLARRAVTLIEDKEPAPAALADAVTLVGEAIRVLHEELSSGLGPENSRERALLAVSEVGRAYAAGVGLSGSVVVAQVRTIASDILRASGIDEEADKANRQIRSAVGRYLRSDGQTPPHTSTAAG